MLRMPEALLIPHRTGTDDGRPKKQTGGPVTTWPRPLITARPAAQTESHVTSGRSAPTRAAVVREFKQPLVIEDRPIPEPSDGQILVKIAASALASAGYVGRVPDGMNPFEAAPVTCAGVTTYEAVKMSGRTARGKQDPRGLRAAPSRGRQLRDPRSGIRPGEGQTRL